MFTITHNLRDEEWKTFVILWKDDLEEDHKGMCLVEKNKRNDCADKSGE